jgi:hypothetical protein
MKARLKMTWTTCADGMMNTWRLGSGSGSSSAGGHDSHASGGGRQQPT